MRINCWHEVGRKNAAKEVVRLRRVPSARQRELRAAIRGARAGEGDGVLFELERGYSDRGRAIARLVVGVGVVVVMGAAVAAFVAPGAASVIIGAVLIPAALVVGLTVAVSWTHDTGVRISAGGMLRAEGWGGIRELDLRSFARITVSDEPKNDIVWIDP